VVHLYDPHHPYSPLSPSRADSRAGPTRARSPTWTRRSAGCWPPWPRGSGRRSWSPSPTTGSRWRAPGAHPRLLRVRSDPARPLVLSYPGVLPPAARWPARAGGRRAPTILELARLPPLAGIDGRSLVPLVTGRRDREPGPAYQESYGPRLWWGAQEILGVRTALVLRPGAAPGALQRGGGPGGDGEPGGDEAGRAGASAVPARPDVPKATRSRVRRRSTRRRRGGCAASGTWAARAPTPPACPGRRWLIPRTSRPCCVRSPPRRPTSTGATTTRPCRPSRISPPGCPLSHDPGKVAKVLLALERYEEAFLAYRVLLAQHPEEEGYHVGLARARFHQGRHAEATAIVRAGSNAFPTRPPCTRTRAPSWRRSAGRPRRRQSIGGPLSCHRATLRPGSPSRPSRTSRDGPTRR